MKKNTTLLLLLIAGSTLLIPSCKKSAQATPAPTPLPATTVVFSATVDGTAKTFPSSYYQAVSGGIYVQGGGTTAPYIQLATQLAQATGTYTIGMGVTATYKDASNTGHIADSGTITISSLANNKISGTFSFVENGGVTITNGVFTDIPKQ